MHRYEGRVRFNEVDGYSHVNNVEYARYLELGRMDALRSIGLRLEEAKSDGIFFVVIELNIRFRSSLCYPDAYAVDSEIVRLRSFASSWKQTIRGSDGTVVVESESRAAVVGPDGSPRRAPQSYLSMFQVLVED